MNHRMEEEKKETPGDFEEFDLTKSLLEIQKKSLDEQKELLSKGAEQNRILLTKLEKSIEPDIDLIMQAVDKIKTKITDFATNYPKYKDLNELLLKDLNFDKSKISDTFEK